MASNTISLRDDYKWKNIFEVLYFYNKYTFEQVSFLLHTNVSGNGESSKNHFDWKQSKYILSTLTTAALSLNITPIITLFKI